MTVIYTPWSNLKKDGSMAVGQVGFHNQKMVSIGHTGSLRSFFSILQPTISWSLLKPCWASHHSYLTLNIKLPSTLKSAPCLALLSSSSPAPTPSPTSLTTQTGKAPPSPHPPQPHFEPPKQNPVRNPTARIIPAPT